VDPGEKGLSSIVVASNYANDCGKSGYMKSRSFVSNRQNVIALDPLDKKCEEKNFKTRKIPDG
jgi:hypothetical protein